MLSYTDLDNVGLEFSSSSQDDSDELEDDPNVDEDDMKLSNEASLHHGKSCNFRVDYLTIDFNSVNDLKDWLRFLKPYGLTNYKKKFHREFEDFEIKKKTKFGIFYLHANKKTLKYTLSFPGAFSTKVLKLIFTLLRPHDFVGVITRIDLRFEHFKDIMVDPFYWDLARDLNSPATNLKKTPSGTTLYVNPRSELHKYKFYSRRSRVWDKHFLSHSIVIEHTLKSSRALSLYKSLFGVSTRQELMNCFLKLYDESGVKDLPYFLDTTELVRDVLNFKLLNVNVKSLKTLEVFRNNEKICVAEDKAFPFF